MPAGKPSCWQAWPGPLPAPPTGLLQGDGPSDPLPPLLSWFLLWLSLAFVAVYLLFSKLALFVAVAMALLGVTLNASQLERVLLP